MKHICTAFALLVALGCLAVTPRVTAQESAPAGKEKPDADKIAEQVKDCVARSRRLRDFGFPLLAREQLDKAKKLDPTSRPLLIEYVRLYTRAYAGKPADFKQTTQYVTALLKLYPDDYDACLEIAWYLFLSDEPPAPPVVKNQGQLNFAVNRLNAEMVVYRELAAFITKPDGPLPASAKGNPRLPLAFLARCAKSAPGTAEVAYLAARDLDGRAKCFQRWSLTDDNLKKPFGDAAHELYGLALPLYRIAARSDEYNMTASVRLAGLLYHMRDYQAAEKAVVAAELVAPGNLDVAEVRLGIAEDMKDYDRLVDALEKMHQIYNDSSSRLDLLVAKRLRDNKWNFMLWHAYRELFSMGSNDRASAIQAMLKEQPEFLELYYLDARNAWSLTLDQNHPEGQQVSPEKKHNLYLVTLSALDKCEALGDSLPDWHGLRASALWQLGKYADAAGEYDKVAAMDKTDTEAVKHAQAGREIAAGDYTAADYAVYRKQLGYGDLKDKRTALREVVARSPKFFAAQLLLGKVAFMLADFETSYGAYLSGHKLEPENIECCDGVARAAMRTGRYDDSLRYFQELNNLKEDYKGALRWQGIIAWVSAGKKERGRAFELWLQASVSSMTATQRRSLLEQALELEPDFAEALVDLAGICRNTDSKLAEKYLVRALTSARDDYTRAAAHREYGRWFLAQHQPEKAIGHFESAYQARKADGMDLLLAALSWHDLAREADASAAMRKLFNEVATTPLLRPSPSDAAALGVKPVEPNGILDLHPAYNVGDVINFSVRIDVENEGGGNHAGKQTLEYDMRVEVLEKPMQKGIWRLKLEFENAPAGFAALANVKTELEISPWFGLLKNPNLAGMGTIANPAVQAIAEGFTAGLGDAPVAPPYVWKNDLTAGPPHFGGEAKEASWLSKALGNSYQITRRALAGRQLDSGGAKQHNFSRALEATVSCGGGNRALREVEFQIAKKELTKAKDDVIFSHLHCKITAK